jgi:hypothetical protein
MRDARTGRALIGAAPALQLTGVAFDGLRDGLLRPGVEPTTLAETPLHLSTVHVSLYLGALSVLITTRSALVERRRRPAIVFTEKTARAVGARYLPPGPRARVPEALEL